MAKRQLMRKKTDQKVFRNTANSIHPKNLTVENARGGIRL